VSAIRGAAARGTHVMFVASITLLYHDDEAMRFERARAAAVSCQYEFLACIRYPLVRTQTAP
jgi:hypothetical protein